MSDSRRGKEGRLGDDTRARINDLKGGWAVPEDGAEDAAEDDARQPPASEAKPAPEDDATIIPADTHTPRKGAPSKPPPLPSEAKVPPPPLARKKGPTKPPPTPPKSARPGPSQPPPIRKGGKPPSLPPPAVVSPHEADDDTPTAITDHSAPDGIAAAPGLSANGTATGTVRLPDSIPRRPGAVGDIAYVFRVWAVRRAGKKELADLAVQITTLKETRNLQLLQVARHAIGDGRNDQTLVNRARDSLLEIEEKRSLHAGRVAAADEKMDALARHREDKSGRRTDEGLSLSKEVDEINTSLEPLQTRTDKARKRAGELRKQLKAIDDKIQKQEASLVSVAGPADKAAVHATIASIRAERDTVAADEPLIAAEIDDLEPKISSLLSTRSGLLDKIVALDKERELDEERVIEKEQAVQASRIVETRAVDDQATKRQDALLELGEALHNKPAADAARDSAIEKQDLEIGTLERRRLELIELHNSVETFPRVMGIMWLLLLSASIAAAVLFVTSR